VERNASAKRARSAGERPAPTEGRRGHVLIVEPDPLTQWSLETYLARWFAIDSTGSPVSAQRILETQPVDALVLSDELPSAALAALEQRAHSLTARVVILRTVTDSGQAPCPGPDSSCLEKPFELVRLAELLGVPESQLPRED
jgi:DNA-binding response OmpR family regulator